MMYLVCDDIAAGDNSDLFVAANSAEQAAAIWRAHWELDSRAMPERIIEVPTMTPGFVGPVEWDMVTQHKSCAQHRDTGRGVCAHCGVAL